MSVCDGDGDTGDMDTDGEGDVVDDRDRAGVCDSDCGLLEVVAVIE